MQIGDVAPVLELELTRTHLVAYAGASHDFNPLHHDEMAATGAGMPSVFGHGMLSAGLIASAIESLVGVGNILDISTRFAKQTWPGETLRTHIEVVGVDDGVEPTTVELECSLANGDGEIKVTGTATARLG